MIGHLEILLFVRLAFPEETCYRQSTIIWLIIL